MTLSIANQITTPIKSRLGRFKSILQAANRGIADRKSQFAGLSAFIWSLKQILSLHTDKTLVGEYKVFDINPVDLLDQVKTYAPDWYWYYNILETPEMWTQLSNETKIQLRRYTLYVTGGLTAIQGLSWMENWGKSWDKTFAPYLTATELIKDGFKQVIEKGEDFSAKLKSFGTYRKPFQKTSQIKTEGQIVAEARAEFRKKKGKELNEELMKGLI